MLFNSGTNTCTNLNVELAKTKHILYKKKKNKRRRHCVQNMMSVSIIWDFYEFIVFTEEILHLLLQELLNFPHTRSELKLWWISSHGSRSRCYIFFYGICSVVFHSHSFSSAPKRILKWEKTFWKIILKNCIIGWVHVTSNWH